MKIVVLGGGNSPKRDVSLRSAAAVTVALQTAGFSTVQIDPVDGFSCLDNLGSDTVIFPVLHGKNGEDGVIQAEFEKRGLAFLGSDSIASALCFDKNKSLAVMHAVGIPIADGDAVTTVTYWSHEMAFRPHVLKVARGGSSIGTYIVREPLAIDTQKVQAVFALDDVAVIEELVEGVELTVPILDGVALPVIEIIPPENAEFDYENKYNGASRELCPPKSLTEIQQLAAQKLAEKVYKVLGSRHLSRVDIIMRHNGEFVVLENNTMPGMTDQSLYPLSAKVAGMPMSELMKKFVELVKRDYKIV